MRKYLKENYVGSEWSMLAAELNKVEDAITKARDKAAGLKQELEIKEQGQSAISSLRSVLFQEIERNGTITERLELLGIQQKMENDASKSDEARAAIQAKYNILAARMLREENEPAARRASGGGQFLSAEALVQKLQAGAFANKDEQIVKELKESNVTQKENLDLARKFAVTGT